MTYQHGVSVSEIPTGVRPPVKVDSALAVYIGTAMIHTTARRANVNKPLLFNSLAEAVEALGPLVDQAGTLYRAIDLHFQKYETGPIVCINVLDPTEATHLLAVTDEEHTMPATGDVETKLDIFGFIDITTVERWDAADDSELSVPTFVGTGDGTLAVALTDDTVPAAEGTYTVTCTATGKFQLKLDGVDVGALIDSDGVEVVRGELTLTITEGATAFIVTDEFTFTATANWTAVDAADYSTRYDEETDDAYLVAEDGGAIVASDQVRVAYTALDESAIAAADIVGSYAAGAYTGLEVVHQVYPRLLKVPSLILCPVWSDVSTVSDKMATVARSVSGQFRAHALVELSAGVADIATYADAAAEKVSQGLAVEDVSACWPEVLLSDGVTPSVLSIHIACLCGLVDEAHGGLPYASPSNQALRASGAVQVNADETLADLFLTTPQANALNAQGIITALNTAARGWVSWGNRTAIYPTDTDPRLSFLALRRMFNHLQNTVILTVERDVDDPGNRLLIDGVVGTIQAMLNGWVAVGALIAGTITFREEDNSVTDMADGKYVFYVDAAPPSPGESIQFKVEYDPTALAALFE